MKIFPKHDIQSITMEQGVELIIAADNSGAIGMKSEDEIHISYERVAYYAFRVAYMECVAAGGQPFAVVIQNFNGDAAWDSLIAGIEYGRKELEMESLQITGSSETNFNLKQSATGISVLGKREKTKEAERSLNNYRAAVIGKPLVGQAVVEQNVDVAPLPLFRWFSQQPEVIALKPVGSKGIADAWKKIMPEYTNPFANQASLHDSAGPATCIIVIYKASFHHSIVKQAGKWLYDWNE
ncbi:ATP-binding protein [Ornithinibacillus gellani]|uniref:ATP-binding protein n=1 Tax=Ornithinibacillus gellani TaxID=2293253 RepID=UPI000F47DBAE|nr:ATP-binding protein [Ornithinibacillus gellani]TQS74758.1 ATP-binding protein [Ornithinibacillus gellani]